MSVLALTHRLIFAAQKPSANAALAIVGVNYLPAKYVRRTETPGKVIMTKAAKCIHL